MAASVLTDEYWAQSENTLQSMGCRSWQNHRHVRKPCYGNGEQAPSDGTFRLNCVPGKPRSTVLNAGLKKGYGNVFLHYETKLMQNGYSSTQVSYAFTSIRVEPGQGMPAPAGDSRQQFMSYNVTQENPVDFEVTGDANVAEKLINTIGTAEYFIADKGDDSHALRVQTRKAGMKPVIPVNSNSKRGNPGSDRHLYRHRHLAENLFARLKHFYAVQRKTSVFVIFSDVG